METTSTGRTEMPFKPNYSISGIGGLDGSILDEIAPDDIRHLDNSALTKVLQEVRRTGLEMDAEDFKENFVQLKADALYHQKTGSPLTLTDQTMLQLGQRLHELATAGHDMVTARMDGNYTAKPPNPTSNSFSDDISSDSDNSVDRKRRNSSYDPPAEQLHYEPLYTPALQNTHANTTGLLNDVTTLFGAMDGYFEAKQAPPDGAQESHRAYFANRLRNLRRQLFEVERIVRDIFYQVEDGRIHPREGQIDYEKARSRFFELRQEYQEINNAMRRRFS